MSMSPAEFNLFSKKYNALDKELRTKITTKITDDAKLDVEISSDSEGFTILPKKMEDRKNVNKRKEILNIVKDLLCKDYSLKPTSSIASESGDGIFVNVSALTEILINRLSSTSRFQATTKSEATQATQATSATPDQKNSDTKQRGPGP